MAVIETRDIVKRFGEITAVAGVDLKVESGECFGLLGPNGAGKTSLIKMVTAVSPITAGRAWVAGMDVTRKPREIKAHLGVVPQEENFDPDFSVLKNLLVFARYFDIPSTEARRRALENLQLFELAGRQKARIRELSGGMKRRLLIARALINQPRILVLDEPTVGLDPQTKHLVWQKLNSLKEQGTTLLLTTQNMGEAAVLCDRLAIMNEGRIVALGSPKELVAEYGGKQIIEAKLDSVERDLIRAELKKQGFYWQELGDALYIFQPDGPGLSEPLKEHLGVVCQRVPTMEDVFLRLTGRTLQE
ncbi:MAG: Daunorubicin/doxorubicin resistance ATP-binding protein DrrA [Dehalococcoidia bacterium]|nr:Daunorubicin/doxorubicin resistance ATP-binding protein DrrA [Chloroflexota bacterium]